jgi:GH25 family lysozyme M1 (1,4-beta-N-acetylmuramidase)
MTKKVETNLKNYAHIFENKIVNVSVWDGETPYATNEELVVIPEDSKAGIGWDYIDGNFTDNRPKSTEIM